MIGKSISAALKDFPEEVQTGINALSQGISIFSKDLILIFYNTKFQEILDLPESLLINNPHFDDLIRYNALRGEYGNVDVEEKVKEMHQLAQNFTRHQFIRKTGLGRSIDIKGVPIPAGGFVTTYTDVTELVEAKEKFEEASQRFKDFTEAASDWYWETDEQYCFTFFSERLETILGVPASSLLGKKRGELAADGGDVKWIEHHRKTENREPFEDFEYEIKSQDGSGETKFCSISGRPIFDKEGKFIGYRGVGKEITEKVMAERERNRSHVDQIILSDILELSLTDLPLDELLEKVLEIILRENRRDFSNKGCVFLFDDTSNHLRMVASIGLPSQVVRRWNILEYGHHLCGNTAQNKEIIFYSNHAIDNELNGLHIPQYGHYCVPITLESKLLGLMNLYIGEDHQQSEKEITFLKSIADTMAGIISRWQTQQDLRKLSQVIEQNPSAILITDVSGKITYVNQSFIDGSGYTSQEVIGQTPRMFKSGATTPEEYEKLWKTISSGQVWNGVFHNKTKNDERRWERATIVPIKNRRGKVISYVGIKEDISGIKAQEKEQERLERELQQAQKMEAIGQLAGGIAHEINTPTQYVSDNLLFLKETWEDLIELFSLYQKLPQYLIESDEAKNFIEEIDELKDELDFDIMTEDVLEALGDAIEGTTQISRIVKAMKDFSHPGQKEMVLADLNKAIQSTATVCKSEWKYVADINFELDETLPQVQCLPGELNQVFLNMIVNAAHAIEERNKAEKNSQVRTITIRTIATDKYVEIQIQDQGNGIPAHAQDKIFNPFFTTKIVGKGTGQGLSISHDVIVKKHNGRIWFETKEGVGTTFHISIPINGRKQTNEGEGNYEK